MLADINLKYTFTVNIYKACIAMFYNGELDSCKIDVYCRKTLMYFSSVSNTVSDILSLTRQLFREIIYSLLKGWIIP